jgi:transglutaminase-like putative cysteine protease
MMHQRQATSEAFANNDPNQRARPRPARRFGGVRAGAILALVLLGVGASPAQEPAWGPAARPVRGAGYVLGIRPVQTITADFTICLSLPRTNVNTWSLRTAKPPVLVGRRAAAVIGTPRGQEVIGLSPQRRRVIRSIVRGQGRAQPTVVIHARYRATLYARQLLIRHAADGNVCPPDLRPAVRASYLRPTRNLDYRAPAFRRWLARHRLQRAWAEDEIAFARRAFHKVAQELAYTFPAKNRASDVVRARKGNCACFANVYVGVLRANGIPARTLTGRWAKSARRRDAIGGVPFNHPHVKAEFFARGVGWVPVDPLGGGFGKDGGNFITYHVDWDLDVPTQISGTQPIEGMQPWAYSLSNASGNGAAAPVSGEKGVVPSQQLDAKKPAATGDKPSREVPPIVPGKDDESAGDPVDPRERRE